MNKLTAREKRLVIFATIFIAGFSLFNWVIRPIWKDYLQVNDQLSTAKRTYIKSVNATRSEANIQGQYAGYTEAYQQLLAQFYANLGEQEAKIKFLALVEELVEGSQVNIVSKNIADGSLEEGFKTVKVNLTVKGAPAQITDLLLALRNSPILINVDRLRIDLDQRNRLLQGRLTVSTPIIQEEGDQDGTEK